MHIHLIFSTKHREPWIQDSFREPLHRYMTKALHTSGCQCVFINSVEDHVHVLFDLGRTVSLSATVAELKRSSSKWIKLQSAHTGVFAWQVGYGAFAISISDVESVKNYIAGQKEHHTTQSFEDEYVRFLKQNEMQYDDKYLWD